MHNKYEIKIIGEYTHEPTKGKNKKPACFYYAEGGVIIIFDPSIKAMEYFIKHKALITNARKIILCFSNLQIYRIMGAYIIDWLFDNCDSRVDIDVYEPYMYDKSVEFKTYTYNDADVIYMNKSYPKYISNKSSEYYTNNDSRLYIGINFTTIRGVFYSFYSLWRCDRHGLWECVLYYNGLSGTMELASSMAVYNNPNIMIFFYINHENSFGTSVDKTKPLEIKNILKNTFRSFSNKIFLLGFNNESERAYLKNLWKDDEPLW
mgnify:CR=1 FL=1